MRAALTLVVFLFTTSTAFAQAWLPAKGEGNVSVLFSNTLSTRHYLPDVAYDRGHIDANTMLFDVTYGVSDRMAVTVGLPMVTSRYRGSFPHRPITLDDGNWHTSAQDFRLNVRYNVFRGPVHITPFIGSYLPANDYEYFAHAAPGRQLKEMATGVSAGRLFAELGLVLQGQYAFNFSQGALDYSRRFSTASVESAYFLTTRLRLMASASGRIGHTGIDLPVNGALLTPDQFLHHDQISRESFFNVMVYSCPCSFLRCGLECCGVALAGADAHGVIEAKHEDLAVADLAGLGGAGDGADDLVDLVAGDRDFDLDFRQEAHRILGPTIDFRVPLLTPVTFDFGNCEPLHADGGQSVTDLVQLEGFNNGHDDLHGFDPRLSPFVYVRSAGGSLSPCPRRSLRRHGRRDRIKRRARCRRRL